MNHKLESRLPGEISTSSDMQIMSESEEELKSLLMKVKEEHEKAGLKLNIWKTKMMASSPITSWQIDGENTETVSDFNFLELQNQCRWWLQPQTSKVLASWKNSLTNLDSVLKGRDITLLTKVCTVKVMFFSSSHVWMWELDPKESWPLKNWCLNCGVWEDSWESLGQQED